jgi:hypothetical protein
MDMMTFDGFMMQEHIANGGFYAIARQREDIDLYLSQEAHSALTEVMFQGTSEGITQRLTGWWFGMGLSITDRPEHPIVIGQRSTNWCISIDAYGEITEYPNGLPSV